MWSSWPSTPPSHSTTAIHLSVAEPAVVRASAPPPRCSCNALQAAHFLSRRVGRPEQLANGAECDGATELGAGSPGGASSAPLASTAGTSTNRRLPLRPPCGEGVSACDAKGFAALPFGTDGRRTPGHAASRHVGSRLQLVEIPARRFVGTQAPPVLAGEAGRPSGCVDGPRPWGLCHVTLSLA